MRRLAAMLMLPVLCACGGRKAPAGGHAGEAAKDSVPPARDSLALTAPGGVEVWYIGQRPGRDSAGASCVERVMEIRRGGTRTLIPLLYTGEAPTLANDSTLRTHLWLNCRPMRLYEVNLRTGRPVPR